MAFKWNPFRRKAKEAPAPEAAPTPTPAPAPPPEPKKPGRFKRLADKIRRKPKEAAPPPEAPPEAPPAAPPVEPSEIPPEAAPAEAAPPAEVPPEEAYAGAPGSLHVVIPGTWVTSKRPWYGVVTGTLHGDDVLHFLMAMDGDFRKGSLASAIHKVCEDFDAQFAAALPDDLDGSSWSTPQY